VERGGLSASVCVGAFSGVSDHDEELWAHLTGILDQQLFQEEGKDDTNSFKHHYLLLLN
jgi:hypothetical protein